MALEALYLQAAEGDTAIEYAAQDVRRALFIGLFGSRGIIPTAGFSTFRVSQRAAGANMSVDVAPGEAVVVGEDVVDQGAYVVSSTEVENRAIPAAPTEGSRTHRVVLRVKDALHNPSFSVYVAAIEVLVDDGTGTPPVPDSAINLATVTVSAGQTSVTDGDITNDPPVATVKPDPVNASNWLDYVPVFRDGTSNIDLGTGGSVSGRYRKIGTKIDYVIHIDLGSDFFFGAPETSGPLNVSLPEQAASPGHEFHWICHVHASKGNDKRIGLAAVFEGGDTVQNWLFTDGSSSGDVDVADHDTPLAWDGAWSFWFTGWYETAN